MGITLEQAHKMKSDMSVDYERRALAQHIVNAYNQIFEAQQRLSIHERELEKLQKEYESPSPVERFSGGLTG